MVRERGRENGREGGGKGGREGGMDRERERKKGKSLYDDNLVCFLLPFLPPSLRISWRNATRGHSLCSFTDGPDCTEEGWRKGGRKGLRKCCLGWWRKWRHGWRWSGEENGGREGGRCCFCNIEGSHYFPFSDSNH